MIITEKYDYINDNNIIIFMISHITAINGHLSGKLIFMVEHFAKWINKGRMNISI